VGLYFIDEPFTGLDAESVGTMQGILELLIHNRKYVLLASHSVQFLKNFKAAIWELGDSRLTGIYSGNLAAEKIEELAVLQAPRLHEGKLEWIR
jgi:ATPase subunit of ABC transporter with duplicated ATPase domains